MPRLPECALPPEIIQANDRRAILDGHIHDLADFRGMSFGHLTRP